ncbi:DUF1801 domain-containing protein [Herbiconiux sp. YIM B11900]|uniref:DUF1801 domain-containing protein n=1 Tax=Herbiconiux sp. YIM B11900 TaxID=3404131 RepID=UPI003F8694BD
MPGIDAYLSDLDHPDREVVLALREVILAADPRVHERVKWNAPSFALADDFATLNLRPRTPVRVVLHTGAKPRPGNPEIVVDDPDALLTRLAPDRAVVAFADLPAVESRRDAFTAILRQWIAQVPA